MKLEDQVCNFELAVELKMLGIEQESAFYWAITENANHALVSKPDLNQSWIRGFTYSAFTVAELGEMLPHSINDWVICIEKHPHDGWFIKYWDNSYKQLREVQDEKESDARAKMLIHLIENGLVNIDDLTKN